MTLGYNQNMSIIEWGTNGKIHVDDGVIIRWRWDLLKKYVLVDTVKKFYKAKLNRSNVPVTIMAKDHIRKIDESGDAICAACDGDLITYFESGLGTIKVHLESMKNFKCVAALAKN